MEREHARGDIARRRKLAVSGPSRRRAALRGGYKKARVNLQLSAGVEKAVASLSCSRV